MTEQYWQRYSKLVAMQPLQRKDQFWKRVNQQMQRRKTPKHHLQLYSMCRSDNPYIRQVRSSPNITNQTVSQLICRDKACQLQYCLSLLKIATQNRRSQLDLNGCQDQYDSMRSCINSQRRNLIKREEDLRNAVFKIQAQQKEVKLQEKKQILEEKKQKIYI